MTKSAIRTLDILEGVARADSGLTHAEISRLLGIPKSSLTSLLRDLVDRRYLEQRDASASFTLGPRVLMLANAYVRRSTSIDVLRPEVERIATAFDETVHVAVRDERDVLIVHHRPGTQPLSAVLRVGDRAPLAATAAGRALLCDTDAKERRELVEAARRQGFLRKGSFAGPFLDPEGQSREEGHGVTEIDGTWVPGLAASAVPLFEDGSARPVAAVSIVVPSSRFDERLRSRMREELIRLRRWFSEVHGEQR